MKVTFLGTGTSQGVPVIACQCQVCRSLDFRDKRLRVSILVEAQGQRLVVDTGPDFRQQMLSARVQNLDAILFTHEHKDHVAGLDDVRAFNFKQQKDMPLFGMERTLAQIEREFYYAFEEKKYPGVPLLTMVRIAEDQPFEVAGMSVQPIPVMHHKMSVLGFRIGKFVYVTDVNYISEVSLDLMRDADVVVLSALQQSPHISHFTLAEAVAVLEEVKPQRAFLTHISHKMGLHSEVEKQLPAFVRLAYDGLVLDL
jgi:phosphoribosyl 1,2-cyclic phosphate phosphodiesterase